MSIIHFQPTTYGFEYGAAKITRAHSDEKTGAVVMLLDTPKHSGNDAMQIYVTKTGKVRVYSADGEWLPK